MRTDTMEEGAQDNNDTIVDDDDQILQVDDDEDQFLGKLSYTHFQNHTFGNVQLVVLQKCQYMLTTMVHVCVVGNGIFYVGYSRLL